MTDTISAIHRQRRAYQEWDAPLCYVCMQKVIPEDMQEHVESHTVKEVVNALVRWSIDSWKDEKSIA